MVWIGDIDIPVISDKDTGIDISTINTNFIDENPQSYKLYSALESGLYSVFLNSNIHGRKETLSEQKDSLLGMVERHGTEFPIVDASKEGFLLVDSVDYFETASEMFDEAEISLRFIPYSDYTVGFDLSAYSNNDDFDVPESSLIAFDSSVTVRESGSILSPIYSYTSEDGDIDYYEYSNSNIKLEFSDFSFEKNSPCRLFSSGKRRYSTNSEVESKFELNNSVIKSEYSSDTSTIYIYNSGWSEIGSVSYPHTAGFPVKNTNQQISCDSISGEQTSIKRGFPLIGYKVFDRSSFSFDFALDAVQSQENHYISATDTSGRELILVRDSDIGSFDSSSSGLSLDNLSGGEIQVYCGFIPSSFSTSDIAQAIYTYGNVRRSFVKNG